MNIKESEMKPDLKCSFCKHKNAVSMWSCADFDLFCCADCAVYVLPSMLADSVHTPANLYAAEQALHKATAQFYRSLWHRTRK